MVAAVALTLTGCGLPRAIEAARVLRDLGSAAEPSRQVRGAPELRIEPLSYGVAGRPGGGDLYEPRGGGRAALVLVPGVTPQGKDDPRLVAFAKTLARARFSVLVPDIASMRALHVSAADARHIADAVHYLAARHGAGGEPRVGLVAISYAVGPALLAALEEDTRHKVRFILAIGGYYEIAAVVRFFTTGHYRETPEGSWRHRQPNAYGKWVFVRGNAERLSDAQDRSLLAEMAERRLESVEADIGDLVPRLGAEGRAVYALLANRDPDRVPALIASLPEVVRRDMAALDLKRRDLSKLSARLILVHGRDDSIIPYSESKALAAALPEGQAKLYVVNSLAHVRLGATGLGDTLVLWRAIYRLLEERDAAPPPRAAEPAARP